MALPFETHAGERIENDLSSCSGNEPAIFVTVDGITPLVGTLRIQSYPATKADWLKSGRWLKRVEAQARSSTMQFCLPIDAPGEYAVAIRHDVNGNGKTDIFKDGGGMSNNPSISIWNLGKPSYRKVGVQVDDVISIRIRMRYL